MTEFGGVLLTTQYDDHLLKWKGEMMLNLDYKMESDLALETSNFSCADLHVSSTQLLTKALPAQLFTSAHKGHYPTTAFKTYSVWPEECTY